MNVPSSAVNPSPQHAHRNGEGEKCLASSPAAASSEVLQVLEGYLAELERGVPPHPDELLARHPDLAESLKAYLASLEFLHRAALSLHGQESPAATSGESAESPGQLGDFRIIREIGRGGMGVVYEAEQISLSRRVALKVLPFAGALDARQLQRFKNEAQAAAQLHHTNIVPVHYVGSERGVHFYAMQFIEGQTLAAVIRDLRRSRSGGRKPPEPGGGSQRSRMEDGGLRIEKGEPGCVSAPSDGERGCVSAPSETDDRGLKIEDGKPDAVQDPRQAFGVLTEDYESLKAPAKSTIEARASANDTPPNARSSILDLPSSAFFRTMAQLGIQAAEALDYAHQMGIIHRDIKPSNLLIENSSLITHDSSLRLWITDFGLAHCQTQAGITMTGDLVGTLRYMSPEQALAKRVIVDHRTDIYSLGATLYELLTLQPAYPGNDRQELLRQIAFEEPKPLRRVNKTIPPELETIVLKAMEKNPADRYSTAQDMADDLHRYLENKLIRAQRPSLFQKVRKWGRRHPSVVWSAVILLLVALIGSIVSLMIIDQKHRETVDALKDKTRALEGEQEAREQTMAALRTLTDDLVESNLAGATYLTDVNKEFLRKIIKHYEGFAALTGDDATSNSIRAEGYFRVGVMRFRLGERVRPCACIKATFKASLIKRSHCWQIWD